MTETDVVNAWNTATMRASQICDSMKPLGGRPWTESQLACFNALSDASYAIRESRILHAYCANKFYASIPENYKAVGYISANGEYNKGCPEFGEPDGWFVLYVQI